jgi:predicted RNA binding protein YcfA (HicA-like mRNA interferase family)
VPVTAKRLVRFLKRRGGLEDRQRGSHLILIHSESKHHVVVPMHAEDLHKGTLLEILKDAGFSLEEFRQD